VNSYRVLTRNLPPKTNKKPVYFFSPFCPCTNNNDLFKYAMEKTQEHLLAVLHVYFWDKEDRLVKWI